MSIMVYKILKNSSKTVKRDKNRQKMKKIHFSFFVSHFSPKNKKLKKNPEKFFVSVRPIVFIDWLDAKFLQSLNQLSNFGFWYIIYNFD